MSSALKSHEDSESSFHAFGLHSMSLTLFSFRQEVKGSIEFFSVLQVTALYPAYFGSCGDGHPCQKAL